MWSICKGVSLASGFSSHSVQPLLLVLVLLLLLNSLTRSSKTTEPVKSIRWPVIGTEQSVVICLWTEVVVGAMVLKNLAHVEAKPASPRTITNWTRFPPKCWVEQFPCKKDLWKRCKGTCRGCKKKRCRSGSGCGFLPWKTNSEANKNKNEDGKTRQKIAKKHSETKPGCLFSVCKRKCDDERIKTRTKRNKVFLMERGGHLWSIVASVTKVVPSLDSKSWSFS